MKLWDELVAVSLVGVGRAPLPPLAAGSPALEAALAGCSALPPERQLLAAATILATWRTAGAVAVASPLVAATQVPAQDDERQPCGPAAETHLARLLAEPLLAPLLPEWLTALRAAGRTLPHAFLPELLDLAGSNGELRTLIAPVLGARGAWLARQNSSWTRLLPVTDREAIVDRWTTAAFPDRVALLAAVRQTGPDLGRELVTSTWEQEPPREREAFLSALKINLSLTDEPLAEAALDDRRKEVRSAAVALAARLPASRLCQRMAARTRPLLAFIPGEKATLRNLGRGKPARLEVTLPEACDKAMQRDGVESKLPPRPLIGERAWWLLQMLAGVPLSTWTEASRATPAELIGAAEGEWRMPVWTGWASAAANQSDAAWADALVTAALDLNAQWRNMNTNDAQAHKMLARDVVNLAWPALTAARREALIGQAFRSENQPLHDGHFAAFLLNLTPPVWSATVSRLVLDSLAAWTLGTDTRSYSDWQLRGWLKTYARALPPWLADEAAALWDRAARGGHPWSPALDEFLTVLQFRRDMLAALNEKV